MQLADGARRRPRLRPAWSRCPGSGSPRPKRTYAAFGAGGTRGSLQNFLHISPTKFGIDNCAQTPNSDQAGSDGDDQADVYKCDKYVGTAGASDPNPGNTSRRRTQVVVELPGGRLHNPCPFRFAPALSCEDLSFTRVIVLLTASTTARKEVFLSVAQGFRKVAEGSTCGLF